MRLFLGLALAFTLATACGQEEPLWVDTLPPSRSQTSAPLDGHQRLSRIDADAVRIVRRAPLEAVSVRQEIQRSRAGERAMLSDSRAGWSLGAGEIRVIGDVAAGDTVRSACSGDGEEPWSVELILETPGGRRVLARSDSGDMAGELWHPLDATLTESGNVHIAVSCAPDVTVHVQEPWRVRPDEDAPIVVLISIDTLRADHLGSYGYTRSTSPHLDRIAHEGFRFERCLSPSPWTLPSYGSLMTGLLPSQHRAGVAARAARWLGDDVAADTKGRERLSENAGTLARVLGEHGFRTAAFYANPFLDSASGLDAGFDRYVRFQYNAAAGVDLALEWLDDVRQAPAFLFLQLTDPHWPYAPPAPWEERFGAPPLEQIPSYPPGFKRLRTDGATEELRRLLVDLYDAEIAFADAQIGRLLEELDRSGAKERTLLVIHADHGEELWDHGGFEHGHTMHEELLNVPLLLRYPALDLPPRVIANQVRAIDVFPTILDLIGVPRPETRGVSLVPLLEDPSLQANLIGVAESLLYQPPFSSSIEEKCLVADGFKLIVGAEPNAPARLYRLGDEGRDVAAENPDLAEELHQRLKTLVHEAAAIGTGRLLEMGAAELDALDHLGYTDLDDED